MKDTIRQRNPSSWEIQVFLGRDASGKRIRKTETVPGKKSEAQRRLREILAELDRGITPSKTRYKLGEWFDKWLQEKIIPNRRQKTIDRYEGIIRLHIKPTLEHIELSKLTSTRAGLGVQAVAGRDETKRRRGSPQRVERCNEASVAPRIDRQESRRLGLTSDSLEKRSVHSRSEPGAGSFSNGGS